MNPRHTPLAWAAAALAAGIVVLLLVRGMGGEATPASEAAPVERVQPAAPVAVPTGPEPAGDPAPWERAQPQAPATVPGTSGEAGRPAAVPEGFDADAQIATIRTQSRQNLAMVDDLLREIDALEASGKAAPEMQLGALRQNLGIARRAQVLALELAESTQQPDTPARRQRTDAIVAELQQLQGQLRYDLMPAGLPAPGQAQ